MSNHWAEAARLAIDKRAAAGFYCGDMDTEELIGRAGKFSELHAQHRPLVLPTVWDVWSARTAVDVGFPALTIGSHPLAESRGAEDNEGQTFAEVIAAHTPPGPGDHSQ